MSVPTDLTLFKRNNGIYYFAYRDGSRRRWKSTGCTTKPDALRCLTERQDLFKPRLPRMSLGRFVAEYETYAASRLSPRTLSGYRDALKGFQRFVGTFRSRPSHREWRMRISASEHRRSGLPP